MTKEKEVFCLTIDARPIAAAPNLSKLVKGMAGAIMGNSRFKAFNTVQKLPSYPAVAAAIRETGQYTTVIYLDGAYTAMLYINKIEAL